MKRAFTLAEVLITLTIIGVIAAITIPNLIQSWKKHQVEVGLKEAYSILSNAYTMAKAEYGSFEDMTTDTYANGGSGYISWTPYFSEKYVEPYIKFTKKCAPRQKNCQVFATNSPTVLDGTTSVDYGYTHLQESMQIALANGMYMTVSDYSYHKTFRFSIDINGGKDPNRYGHDMFIFTINEDFKLVGGAYWEKGAWNTNNWATCSGSGLNCAYVIMKNGWKIPDNYPIKKF